MQKAIFTLRTRKPSNVETMSSNQLPSINKVLTLSMQIDSADDSVEIFEKNPTEEGRSPTKQESKGNRARKIQVKVEPIMVGISYWSLERIFLVINSSIGHSKGGSRVNRFLDNLKLLKDIIYQRPLNYLENYLSAERKKNIVINLNVKSVCLKVYESSHILKNSQVLDLKINNLDFCQKALDTNHTDLKGPEKYEVFVEREISLGYLTISTLSHQGRDTHFPASTDLDGKDWRLKPILTTSAMVLIKSNLIKNSPLLIDQTVKVFIPKIEVSFPNDTYHIAKIISIVSQQPNSERLSKVAKGSQVDGRFLQIASLVKEISPLLIDIEKEHGAMPAADKKVCRHCILKYRKATLIFELIVGDHGNYDHLVRDFKKENLSVNQGINGIYIKIPVSIENSILPLNIGIPFLMIAHEFGPFKENTAVFISKVHSVTKDKFDLEVIPHYALVEPERLFSSSFTKTLWKTFLDYHKSLSTGQADGRIFRESSSDNQKASGEIHLLMFRRHYMNKAMLGYLDGVRKSDVDSVYKQFVVSKLKSVSIESHDMSAFASAFNILTNIMLNATLERFIEQLLRPIQATGLDRKLRKVERILHRGKVDVIMKEDREMVEMMGLEEEIGPVIEFKDVFTLKELFAQLMLDVSIEKLKFKINFEDKSSGVRIFINAKSTNTVLNVNTERPSDYLRIDEFKLTFGEHMVKLRNIAVNYEESQNKFEFKFGNITVDSKDPQEGRLLQIGLDDTSMSKQLQYYAIYSEVFFREDDVISSRRG